MKKKPGRKTKPSRKTKTNITPRWSLISLGIVLSLIVIAGGVYVTVVNLLPSSKLVIRDISVSGITGNSVIITWVTDEPATGQTMYGYTIDCGFTTALNQELVTEHKVEIIGLNPDTTYYFRAISKDAGRKKATSDTGQFKTLLDTTPPTISKVNVAGYTGDTATITWETDEDAMGQIEYGETDAYGKLATFDGESTTVHSIELTGLQPNTKYHFRVKSTDKSGNQSESGIQSFTNWVAEKDWAKYVNKEYGFSIQYPCSWTTSPEIMTRSTYHYLAAFRFMTYVPGLAIAVFDADEPVSEDWAIKAYKKMDCFATKVVSPITETTLPDGTKATTYKIKYVALNQPNQGEDYEITSYCLDADKGSKRIQAWVFTIDSFYSYDEALFSQIAHTLRFSTE